MVNYERPNLEELELILEGSFLTIKTGVGTGGDQDGDEVD